MILPVLDLPRDRLPAVAEFGSLPVHFQVIFGQYRCLLDGVERDSAGKAATLESDCNEHPDLQTESDYGGEEQDEQSGGEIRHAGAA